MKSQPTRRVLSTAAGARSISLKKQPIMKFPFSLSTRRGTVLALWTLIPWCILTGLYLNSQIQKHDEHLAARVVGTARLEGRNLRTESSAHNSNDQRRNMPDSITMNFFPDTLPEPPMVSLQDIHQVVMMNPTTLSDLVAEDVAVELPPPSVPPKCDKIPIDGGRFMYRNRVRIADKELTEICGPRLLIIGAQRCGTDTLADLLFQHPRIKLNQCSLINTKGGPLSCHPPWFQRTKQGNYFNVPDFTHHRRSDSESWLNTLARRMPLTDGINTTTFEKSSTYMETQIFDDVAETAHKTLPNAKIVATLCHPAERLYSEFHHPGVLRQLYLDNDLSPPQDFAAFVDLFKPDHPICQDKPGFCETHRNMYLAKGEYSKSLQPWFDAYGRENVLLVNMDDRPERIVEQLLVHVGHGILPPVEYPWDALKNSDFRRNRNFGYEGRASAYNYFEPQMKWLEEHFAPHNDALAASLGDDRQADWPRQWNCRHFPMAEYCKNPGNVDQSLFVRTE